MDSAEKIMEDINNPDVVKTGKQMREKLHEWTQRVYEDATKKGNANMEVANARGTFDTLKNRLDNSDNLKASKEELNNTKNNIQGQIINNSTQIDIQKSRIDQLTQLEEGSTTGDAELIDARISYDNYNYSNMGNGLREQIKQTTVDYSVSPLADFYNTATSKCNSTFYFNDRLYKKGFLKSIDINIIEEISGNWAFVICDSNYKILYKSVSMPITKPLHREINLLIKEDFYIGISCVNMGFKTVAESPLKYADISNYTMATYVVGDILPIQWLENTKFVFDYQLNMKSRLDMLIDLAKLGDGNTPYTQNVISVANGQSFDFNELEQGFTYIGVSYENFVNHNTLLENAPNPFGAYNVMTFLNAKTNGTKYFTQVALCLGNLTKPNKNELSNVKSGLFVRAFSNDGHVQSKWTYISPAFNLLYNNYIALGDSITWGYIGRENGVSKRTDYPYPYEIAVKNKLNLYYGAQSGAGFVFPIGTQTAVSIVDEQDFSNMDLVTIAFGVNDYLQNQPLGTINDNGINTVCGAFKHCIQKIINDNPLAKIVVITPLNTTVRGNQNTDWAFNQENDLGYTLLDLTEKLIEMCEFYRLDYINNYKNSVINKININVPSNIFVDGLHPNGLTYNALGCYYAGKISGMYSPYYY